jgi:hypothetical protein
VPAISCYLSVGGAPIAAAAAISPRMVVSVPLYFLSVRTLCLVVVNEVLGIRVCVEGRNQCHLFPPYSRVRLPPHTLRVKSVDGSAIGPYH